MLTDIFADRYVDRVLWSAFTQTEAKLLNQCFRMVAEQLIPYWIEGKANEAAKAHWQSIHDRLSMELGLMELGPKFYSYPTTVMGKPHYQTGSWTLDKVCKDFVCARFPVDGDPDRFMKERLSFIELAFRGKDVEIQALHASLPDRIAQTRLRAARELRLPGDIGAGMEAWDASLNTAFQSSVNELNERFRRAGVQLNYHNGFLQIAADARTGVEIEQPFWAVVADPIWKNVDIDMKEALDRRDANERDPAFYAARALESAIKIISDSKGWTHGREKGAHSYIDNLGSAKNGTFIEAWERDTLKSFFTEIRNPIGHGPGSDEMPELSEWQTNWAIESCMSWIKSLIGRI